jgi:hypothetical protein
LEKEMLTKQLKSALTATAVAGAMLVGGSGTASAVPFIAFNFNYGLGSVSNVGILNGDDPSFVRQTFDINGPNGAFIDKGSFRLTSYNSVFDLPSQQVNAPDSLPGIGGANQIILFFDLTGNATTVAGQTTLTFNPGGQILMYQTSAYNSGTTEFRTTGGNVPDDTDAGMTLLGAFTLTSAGAKGTFLTDTLSVNSFQFNFIQTGGNNNLFEDYPSGDDLFNGVLARAYEFGSADVQTGAVVFAPCTGEQAVGAGANELCSNPNALAHFRLASTPEPGTLGLFGTGLALLGLRARRRKVQAAK